MKIPKKQEKVWCMHLKGIPQSEIARKLGLSRQAISLYLREAVAKLNRYFIELSEVMDLDIKKLDAFKGFLIGINRQTGEKVYLIYIPSVGVRALYYSEKRPLRCSEYSNCKEIINYISQLTGKKTERESLSDQIRETINTIENLVRKEKNGESSFPNHSNVIFNNIIKSE
ncbi:MAG: hypothetical protein ACP6IP_10140 [Candidatus Njordarchaeia archaeon]